jgi:hypothetical protein
MVRDRRRIPRRLRPSRMTRIVGCLMLVLVACAEPATESPAPAVETGSERSMKGWELYSWRDGSEWRFALVVGTNAIRPAGVITEQARDLAALEAALTELAPGEEIVWPGPTARHGSDDDTFALPDAATRARIERVARDRGLTLQILER